MYWDVILGAHDVEIPNTVGTEEVARQCKIDAAGCVLNSVSFVRPVAVDRLTIAYKPTFAPRQISTPTLPTKDNTRSYTTTNSVYSSQNIYACLIYHNPENQLAFCSFSLK